MAVGRRGTIARNGAGTAPPEESRQPPHPTLRRRLITGIPASPGRRLRHVEIGTRQVRSPGVPWRMRRPGRHERWVIVAGLGVFTAGIGHVLTYAVMSGHPPEMTGAHGYFTVALLVAAGLGLSAAAGAFAIGVRSGLSRSSFVPWPSWQSAGALMLCNSLLFATQEGLESLWSGGSLDASLVPLLAVGVAVQLVLGLLAAMILGGLHRAGRCLGEAVARRPRRPARAHRRPIAAFLIVSAAVSSPGGIRGPPVPLS